MNEYTVFWIINVLAESPADAASEAQQYMTDCNCQTFHVVEGIAAGPDNAIEVDA